MNTNLIFSHDFNPYIPEIPGMELFEGRTIHSKSFRYEEEFEGLRVAILGCHFSGEDIAMLVSSYAKKVSHAFELNIILYSQMQQLLH